MIFEVDTDIRGVTLLLSAMAQININDAKRDPEVAKELLSRCFSNPRVGFLYVKDPKDIDRWSSFVPMMRRTKSGDPIKADCEDQSASYASAFKLAHPDAKVEVSVTQPHEGAMAHAYVWIDDRFYDPSAVNGMRRPPDSFYGSGDTARILIV